jgi:ubiquinone/menaquinone biosynthesis C-methylase UbiE
MLDFACGTGNFSCEFAKCGIDVIGVDISEGMLCEAREKNENLKNPVMYLCQSGEELDLYGTVDGAVSCLDSLNHITSFDALKKTLKKISLFLEPGRLFVFDMNTLYKHREVLGNNSYKMHRRGVTCFWSNRLLDDTVTTQITIDFVYKTGLFKKETVCEQFLERAYTDEEIMLALTEAGLRLEAVFEENTFGPPSDKSQRNIYVTRKI